MILFVRFEKQNENCYLSNMYFPVGYNMMVQLVNNLSIMLWFLPQKRPSTHRHLPLPLVLHILTLHQLLTHLLHHYPEIIRFLVILTRFYRHMLRYLRRKIYRTTTGRCLNSFSHIRPTTLTILVVNLVNCVFCTEITLKGLLGMGFLRNTVWLHTHFGECMISRFEDMPPGSTVSCIHFRRYHFI